MKKHFNKNGFQFTYEEGHTLEEYKKEFGRLYNEGELWDILKEELEDGSIDANPEIIYWLIKDEDGEERYFETDISVCGL